MLEQFTAKNPDIFDSRRALVGNKIADGEVTALCPQQPAKDTWYDLDLAGLRVHTRTPVQELVKSHRDRFHSQFPETKGWFGTSNQREIRKLTFDLSAKGARFREALSGAAAGDVRLGVKRAILDASKALPTPHELFDQLLLQGAIRIPPNDLIPLNQLAECTDPHLLIKVAKKIWSYSGLEGIAGDHGYADLEGPPDATLATYHGNPSRAGFDLKSRIAWSSDYQTALVTQTPIAMSNMEANSDIASSRLALQAGIMPVLFSSPKEERLEAARTFGRNILITVRTSADEIELAKELLKLGANVHIEAANSFNHICLEAIIELKKFIRESNFPEPRFVTLGKSVGGAFLIAAILAGVDGVFINRGSSMICSTPTVTGIGMRTWSAVFESTLAQHLTFILTGRDVPFWADAGVSCGADITKATIAGAEGTMVGTTFIRTIDSPPKKQLVELPDGRREWRTESWGDASLKGQRHKVRKGEVAPQGVSTTHSIPLSADGKPLTIADVSRRLQQEVQAGGADLYVESACEIPLLRGNPVVRFPEEGALLELKAKEKPISGKVIEERGARVGED